MDNPGRANIMLEEAKLKQCSFEFIFSPTYSWSAIFLDCQQFLRLWIGTETQNLSLFTPWREQLYILAADRLWPDSEKHLDA